MSIPHRPPWLLVDRVISIAGDTVEAEKRLSADDPLVGEELLDVLVIEALAQTAAHLNTAQVGEHRGFLVAAQNFEFASRAKPGQTLQLRAKKTAAMGALYKFEGEARADGELVARGTMTFAVQT